MLVGKLLTGVTASWYLTVESDVAEILHAWLQVKGLGFVRCHTMAGLRLDPIPPYGPYEMPELDARVEVVEETPAPLAELVGSRITGTTPVKWEGNGCEIGFVLETTKGSVVIADVGDDLVIGDWAERKRWADAQIVALS
jgi:hypothetical protein